MAERKQLGYICLTEDLGAVPVPLRLFTATPTPVSGDLKPFFEHCGHQGLMLCTYLHVAKTLVHINKINESKTKNITEMTTYDSHFLAAFSATALV